MKLKDLIGHKILDISDDVALLIKTDKGVYKLQANNFPDGTLEDIDIKESNETTWRIYNGYGNL